MKRITVECLRKFTYISGKDLQLPLAEMCFSRSFIGDRRGDPYPLLSSSAEPGETVEGGVWRVCGSAERLLGSFFPYASYELKAIRPFSQVGFVFRIGNETLSLTRSESELFFSFAGEREIREIPDGGADSLIVSCRPGFFDVFFRYERDLQYFTTFDVPGLSGVASEAIFSRATVSTLVESGCVERVRAYLDSGIGIADVRPIRYENGEVMVEGGKVYLTVSIRLVAGKYQGVLAWVPGTSDLSLVGAIFYDAGDGVWSADVAASILYHREKRLWYLWACSFSHGHVLCHASFEGDVRFGVNVVDVRTMPLADENDDRRAFLGFAGDEDPDFFYDAERGIWTMAICRLDGQSRTYRYRFFESESPFDGYRYIGEGESGAETGGSFVRLRDERVFICGNDFHARSDYRIYDKDGMYHPTFNYPDGGFRGWGTLIPIKLGTRTRYFWLTFDRRLGSDYNWSYGNLYCFEAYLD